MGKTDGGSRSKGSDEITRHDRRLEPDDPEVTEAIIERAARRAQTIPPARAGLPPMPRMPSTAPTPPPSAVEISSDFDDDDEVTRMMGVDPLASYHASALAQRSATPAPGPMTPGRSQAPAARPPPAPVRTPPPPPVRTPAPPNAAVAKGASGTHPSAVAPRSSTRPAPPGVTPPTPFTESLRATISGHGTNTLTARGTLRSGIMSSPLTVEPAKTPLAPPAQSLTPATTSLPQRHAPAPLAAPALGQPALPDLEPSFAQQKFKRLLISVVAVLALLITVGLAFLLRAPRGDLLVTIRGPAGEAVRGLEIFIDGQRRCSKSPCALDDLTKGAHAVRATGPGYAPMAERQVLIDPDRKAVLELNLPPDSSTGVRVTSKVDRLRLWVDDRESGTLPREVGGLAPGQHTLKVEGNPAFRPLEQKVDVKPGVISDVQVAPQALEGTLRVEAGHDAHGAQVSLVYEDGKQQILGRLPAEVALKAERQPTLIAKKGGYQEFRKTLEFAPGESRLTVTIELTPKEASPAPEPAPEPAPIAKPAPEPKAKAAPPSAPAATPAEPAATVASGTGKVNVNSIPPSSVRVNGKDLGSTPKMAVEVPAGQVTAVFTHPELGTQVRTGVVKAGGTLALSVRFKQGESAAPSRPSGP